MNGGTVLSSSAPRQSVLRNFWQWICVVVYAASVPPPSAGAIAAVIVMLIATVACMFLVDTAATKWARGLPQWFDDVFERITDLGLGGLVPISGRVHSALPRRSDLAVADTADARRARDDRIFSNRPLSIVKRLIGRARLYVGSPDVAHRLGPKLRGAITFETMVVREAWRRTSGPRSALDLVC